MFGAPILKLPKADQQTHWCEFNPIERIIYDIVQKRFVERINTMSRNGNLDRSYSNVLVMLLRLRQLTAHVLMLQNVMKDLLEREDIEQIRVAVKKFSGAKNADHTVVAVRKQLEELEKEEKTHTGSKNNQEEESDVEDIPDEYGAAGKGFGKDFDFKPYLKSLQTGESWEKAKKEAVCCVCTKNKVRLMLTSCNHLYCDRCYEDALIEEASIRSLNTCDDNDEPGYPTCNKCGQKVAYASPCGGERSDSEQYVVPETRASRRRKGKEPLGNEDLEEKWLSFNGLPVLPSAKTIGVKAQLLNWFKENPDAKVIIYTQFVSV